MKLRDQTYVLWKMRTLHVTLIHLAEQAQRSNLITEIKAFKSALKNTKHYSNVTQSQFVNSSWQDEEVATKDIGRN